jgi:hypothetical protein
MESFGRRALLTSAAEALVNLEQAENKNERFSRLDSLVGDMLVRSLRGERILTMKQDELYVNSVTFTGLSHEQREFLDETFELVRQQSRGAWFIPERVNIGGGIINFSYYFTETPRFAHTMSSWEGGRVLLKRSPDSIFLWAVLEPLFEEIVYPFQLRGELSGTLSQEENAQAWDEVQEFFRTLGFPELEEMAVMRHGGGWHRFKSAAEQLEAKRRLLDALAREVSPLMGTRYRTQSILPLIKQYYKKAKADGRVKRKQVLTKAFQPLLSGFFGGDWLSLLDYLGEVPHPEEQIVTALPKTPIKVGGASRAAEIAAKQGIPTEEVQKIAAALWQQSGGASPIEERVSTLRRYWQSFDEIHARQSTGMKPLWGLVEESASIDLREINANSPYQPKLYLEFLPQDLIQDIERLWGTIMLTKWPDRIVSEPFPHYLMVSTFGPALKFWQSCALTAWFICEGPYSRTDMAGLAHHERRELSELKEMQTPVDERLFEELIKAEGRLGPAEDITDKSSSTDVGYGVTITMSISSGSRRKGFESLRDIITRHRRAWTAQYLETYLRCLWETEISEAARAFNLLLGEKGGKAPTLKQFAKAAMPPTNHWFGGDVSALYGAIGEKSPAIPQRNGLMPQDKERFVRLIMEPLPSLEYERYPGRMSDEATQDYTRKELAELGLRYLQLEEALGRPPEMKEIGEKFTYRSKVLAADDSEAWQIYKQAVERAKRKLVQQTIKSEAKPVASQTEAHASPTSQALEETPAQRAATPTSPPPTASPAPIKPETRPNPSETRPQEEQPKIKRSWLDRLLGRR